MQHDHPRTGTIPGATKGTPVSLGLFRKAIKAPRGRTIANASAVSAITLGIVGVMLGTGVASTAIGVTDGVTWLADPATGEVLQYNPSTKRVEKSYQVGQAGDPIEVAQANGGVVLRNGRTGEVLTVDMANPGAGRRASGDKAKVVMAKGLMAVADTERGTVTRIDPVKATDLGSSFQVPGGELIAAVADEDGTIWVATSEGKLIGLRWQDSENGFVKSADRALKNPINPGAVLSPHPKGVTLFDARSGVIAQSGTGSDVEVQENRLIGADPTKVLGPADLVPATLTEQSAVVVLDRGRLTQYSTAGMGCDRPVDPVAFNDVVYVVCQGSQKVIRLTRTGAEAGPEIRTPGNADAKPVTDEGRLVLNVSGAEEGIEIDRTGTDQRFDRRSRGASQQLDVQESTEGSGVLVARENAQQDLKGEPGQGNGSGGSVNTSPDQFDDRAEVVRGNGSRAEETSSDASVHVPGEDQIDLDRNRGNGTGGGNNGSNDNGNGPRQDDPTNPNDGSGNGNDRGNGNDEGDNNGRGSDNGNDNGRGNGNDPVPTAPVPTELPTGSVPTDLPPGPVPTDLPTGPGGPTVSAVPTGPIGPGGTSTPRLPGPTVSGEPSASASGSAPSASRPPATTAAPTTTSAPATPKATTPRATTPKASATTKAPTTTKAPATTPAATTKQPTKSPTTTRTTTKAPTTTATKTTSPKPTGGVVKPSVSGVSASSPSAGKVNVSWKGSNAKSYKVTVGNQSTPVNGGSTTAVLTGVTAGSQKVTVTAINGSQTTTATGTVTVKGSTPTATTTKAPTKTTAKPTSNPTGEINQSISITSAKKASATSVTFTWSHDGKNVQHYRVYCNGVEKNNFDVGPGTRTATVSCGPLKGGVYVGVKGYNSAHSTPVREKYVNN